MSEFFNANAVDLAAQTSALIFDTSDRRGLDPVAKIEHRKTEFSPFFVFKGDQKLEVLYQRFSLNKYLKGLFSGKLALKNGYFRYYKPTLFKGTDAEEFNFQEHIEKLAEDSEYASLQVKAFVGVRGTFSDEADLLIAEVTDTRTITQIYKCRTAGIQIPIMRGTEVDITSQVISSRIYEGI